MRRLVPAIMLLGIGWLTTGPSAQGLGDVARREAARRQQVTAGKKYTNEDVQAAAPVVAPAPAEVAPAGAPGAAAGSAGGEAPAAAVAGDATGGAAPKRDDVKSVEEKRGEQFWRDKAKAIRSEMEKSIAKAAGLKMRLESLDEQLRNGAGASHAQEREVTLKALEKADYGAKSMREEWERLGARAQAAKVPAEWLR
jgi:hypothetical protein